MAVTKYAVRAFPYLKYTGTNSSDIVAGLQPHFSVPVTIVSEDAGVLVVRTVSVNADSTMHTGDHINLVTGDVVSAEDWTTSFILKA